MADVEVLLLPAFTRWLDGLRDRDGRKAIDARLARLARGHWGDVRPVGDGVQELRIHAGPGYRVYLVRRGARLIVVLAGGDKGSQARDIAAAKAAAADLDR